MSFQTLVEKRESCRNFNGNKVMLKDLEHLIKWVRLAPSACNGQPWHFSIITENDVLIDIAKHMQAFNKDAGALIVITEQNSKVITRAGEIVKNQCYRSIDIGIAAAYLTLGATELGISSCIIGWFDEKAIKKRLGIPSKKRVRLIISLGYTDVKTLRPKKRKTLEEISTFINE